MPDALTPTRLRALVAAAAKGPWTMDVRYREVEGGMEVAISIPELSRPQVLTGEQLADWGNQLPNVRLLEAIVNNAPALADALEANKIYEDALVAIDQGRTCCKELYCWTVAEQALIKANALHAAKESA